MSEQSEHNNSLTPASAEQDVVVLIKKMQQQLVLLDKKIDILINQSQTRPFREKHFSKPFRSFGHPHRSSEKKQDNTYGEKRFDRGRHFEKYHNEENQGFGHKKKTYSNSGTSDSGQGHPYEKRHGGEKRGFDQKKKPFYHKRKHRR